MKTLLAILGHSTVTDIIQRHHPFWLKSECDLLLVGRENTTTHWPPAANHRVYYRNYGPESYVKGDNHIRRFMDVLTAFLWEPDFMEYKAICITEYDAITLRPIPFPDAPGLHCHIGGYHDVAKNDTFHAEQYLHTPWLMNRTTANDVFQYGMRLHKANLIERGFVDRWLGLMTELYHIPVVKAQAFSVNALDRPDYIAAARTAIQNGAWHVHGIKTAQQLQAIDPEK